MFLKKILAIKVQTPKMGVTKSRMLEKLFTLAHFLVCGLATYLVDDPSIVHKINYCSWSVLMFSTTMLVIVFTDKSL